MATIQTQTLGAAPIVRRRTATWPSRVATYFDFSQWGGGFARATGNGPGAFCINDTEGIMADIQTGRVYCDSRFIKGNRQTVYVAHVGQ